MRRSRYVQDGFVLALILWLTWFAHRRLLTWGDSIPLQEMLGNVAPLKASALLVLTVPFILLYAYDRWFRRP